MLFLLQLGVLALTVVLWWRVQQDLAGRAATPRAEWERLRATVEQLTADLERRAVVAEQRVAAAEASLETRLGVISGENVLHSSSPLAVQIGEEQRHALLDVLSPPQAAQGSVSAQAEDRFAHAERLIAAGVVNATDIAQQTGVSRGEAELLLSLRARRV